MEWTVEHEMCQQIRNFFEKTSPGFPYPKDSLEQLELLIEIAKERDKLKDELAELRETRLDLTLVANAKALLTRNNQLKEQVSNLYRDRQEQVDEIEKLELVIETLRGIDAKRK